MNGALVRHTYPHRSLGHALGINAFVVATAAAVGPTIASGILAVANWRWLFGINVPLGVVAIVIALCALPDSERTPRRLNIAGAVLYAAAMGLLLSGLQTLAHRATLPLALAQIGGGCLFAWLLVRHERPRAAPLVPFDLLRSRSGAAGGMLAAARLIGQTIGAAAVAILFHAYGEAGSNDALMLAACLALAGGAISVLRLAPKSASTPARS